MRRDEIPTPALVLDHDALEANIAVMMAHVRKAGVGLRAHAKSHKCVEIARLLATAGAVGPACATIAEAEAMAAGGVGGILITSPVVTPHGLTRLQAALARGGDIAVVADHLDNVPSLAAVAAAAGIVLPVLVELDVGVGRTGCASVEDALAVATKIAGEPALRFAGVQAYWGNLQQVMPFTDRRARVDQQAGRVRELLAELRKAGIEAPIVTGGGTGTSFIDAELKLFTELQCGSFLFLDSLYGSVPLDTDVNPFTPSLFVATAVVSASRPGRIIVNAGLKALATDSGKPRAFRGAPDGAAYSFMGDEHGLIEFTGNPAPALGAIVELLTPHCDPTVNLHARYVVVRGDEVVATWPVIARGYDIGAAA